jgi:glycine/D-amino acid oxidase-like deaminating enzyme
MNRRMARLRLARPIWLDQSPARPASHPPLRRTIDVDVAIVGGGITGTAVAWRLASAGVRVAILERDRIGRGSTVASTALLMQEPDDDFGKLRDRYGSPATKRIWQLSQKATADFVSAIRRLAIRCDLAERDSVYYTLQPEREAYLRREHEDRRRAGVGGRWLDGSALLKATGMSGVAAIRTRGNAQADPYKVCIGLLKAALDHGALAFEHSPVRRTRIDHKGVVLTTHRGAVRAAHVVVATGYATPEFKPLAGRFKMLHTYVVATEPLPSSSRRELGLSNVMLWDTDRPYHYVRWTRDFRLLLGGADRRQLFGTARKAALRRGTEAIVDYFTNLYPPLGHVRIDYAWEGLFAQTPDSLPYIGPHRRYPRHLFALGYGGNGMTLGFLASRLICERLSGAVTPDHDLFSFGRLR